MAKIVLISALILYLISQKIISMATKIKGTAPEAFNKIVSKYGKEFAKECEQALRLETAHFTSGQWLKCGSGGMVATKDRFPYGWTSLEEFAEKHNIPASSFGLVTFNKTVEGKKTYIRWAETGQFIEFFAWFIQTRRNGNVSAWYRISDKDYDGDGIGDQTEYRNAFKNIKTQFV